jgi:hypothetical protein
VASTRRRSPSRRGPPRKPSEDPEPSDVARPGRRFRLVRGLR